MLTNSLLPLAGTLSLIGYLVFGLSISALTAYSKLAIVFATIGLLIAFIQRNSIDKLAIKYLFVYTLILFSWGIGSKESWTPIGNYLTSAMGALLVYLAIARRWLKWEHLLVLLCLPAAINLFAYFQGINYTEINFDIDGERAMRRFSGFIGHPSTMITRVNLPIILFTYLIIIRYKFQNKYSSILLLSLSIFSMLFGIISSGSKKGLLLGTICIAFIAYAALFQSSLPKRISAFTAALFSVVLGWLYIDQLEILDIEALDRLFAALAGGDESTEERALLVRVGIELFTLSPILGYGLSEFENISGFGYYSHNNFIEMLINGGAIIFGVYYIFIGSLIINQRTVLSGLIPSFFAVAVLLAFDLTGVTASDRAGQIFVAILMAGLTLHRSRQIERPHLK